MITVITSEDGDWEALYLDGELKLEGHSLAWEHILDLLGIEYEKTEIGLEALEQMAFSFPKKLTDVAR